MPRAVGAAVVLHLLLIGLGFASRQDTLLDLIDRGQREAVIGGSQAEVPVTTVELLAFAEEPPAPLDTPAFVVPREAVEPPLPKPEAAVEEESSEELREEAVAVVAKQEPPAPEPSSAMATAAASEMVSSPVAIPAPIFAQQEVVIGNKDFPKPPYPYAAKRNRYEGTVTLNLSVADGRIVEVEVARSSGHAILDSSAAAWIRQRWRFAPGISRTLSQAVTFQLSDG
ncbi:energy transducer TonB [Verrucomicrobium sp. GAS474]|uniref:energy transducer TonB n=1 Tax=Verrucomicrobium sp. GAS474 TaxID=1882831 RepID=UPI0012FFA93B|nr:energy transducer TonB [Verrucomicrobium sp. GAS474]